MNTVSTKFGVEIKDDFIKGEYFTSLKMAELACRYIFKINKEAKADYKTVRIRKRFIDCIVEDISVGESIYRVCVNIIEYSNRGIKIKITKSTYGTFIELPKELMFYKDDLLHWNETSAQSALNYLTGNL